MPNYLVLLLQKYTVSPWDTQFWIELKKFELHWFWLQTSDLKLHILFYDFEQHCYNAVSPKGTCIVNAYCQFSWQACTNFMQTYRMSNQYWANFLEIWVHKRVRDGNPYSFMYSNFQTHTRLSTQVAEYGF